LVPALGNKVRLWEHKQCCRHTDGQIYENGLFCGEYQDMQIHIQCYILASLLWDWSDLENMLSGIIFTKDEQ